MLIKNIDKVLHKISIPMRLTNETQPMQGVTFDEKILVLVYRRQ